MQRRRLDALGDIQSTPLFDAASRVCLRAARFLS
jgi:hypothetical protein